MGSLLILEFLSPSVLFEATPSPVYYSQHILTALFISQSSDPSTPQPLAYFNHSSLTNVISIELPHIMSPRRPLSAYVHIPPATVSTKCQDTLQ